MKLHRAVLTFLFTTLALGSTMGQPDLPPPPGGAPPGMEPHGPMPRGGGLPQDHDGDGKSWGDRRGGRDRDSDKAPGDAFDKLRSSTRALLRSKWEADQLANTEKEVEKTRARTKARLEAKEISGERAERLERICTLKMELLPLQKAEFVDRMKESTEEGIATLTEARKSLHDDDPRIEIVDGLMEKAEALRGKTTDFETLHAALEEMGPFRGGRGGPGPEGDNDPRQREIEELRRRLDRLEMENTGPDDRSTMYGVDDAPPGIQRNPPRRTRPNDP